MISFIIPGRVRGQARIRHCGKQHFMDVKTRSDRAFVAHFAAQAMKGCAPFDGPLSIDIQVILHRPGSWSKKKKATTHWPTIKPDVDNQIKLIGDACNNIVWHDDSQIAAVKFVRKYDDYDIEHVAVTVVQIVESPASLARSAAA